MARIPTPDSTRPESLDLVRRITAERGSVLHIYRMLLRSAPLAEGWLSLLTAVRQRLSVPGDLRELVIVRIAGLNGAAYEADQHAPIALREGVTAEQLAALDGWPDSTLYSAPQRAALALTDAMTRDVRVPKAVFDELQPHFDEVAIVELVATIAAYNMVSRFLVALDVHSDDRPEAASC